MSDGHGALGEHHHVDDVDFIERRSQDAIEQVEVEALRRDELEEAERLAFRPLCRFLERSEVAVPDA